MVEEIPVTAVKSCVTREVDCKEKRYEIGLHEEALDHLLPSQSIFLLIVPLHRVPSLFTLRVICHLRNALYGIIALCSVFGFVFGMLMPLLSMSASTANSLTSKYCYPSNRFHTIFIVIMGPIKKKRKNIYVRRKSRATSDIADHPSRRWVSSDRHLLFRIVQPLRTRREPVEAGQKKGSRFCCSNLCQKDGSENTCHGRPHASSLN